VWRLLWRLLLFHDDETEADDVEVAATRAA
jgi:hypothetical protein